MKLKATSDSYPLRKAQTQQIGVIPDLAEFELAFDTKLQGVLSVGNYLKLGHHDFKVKGVYQANSLQGLSAFAPEITIRLADLSTTQLLGPVNRATYELSVAGSLEQVKA